MLEADRRASYNYTDRRQCHLRYKAPADFRWLGQGPLLPAELHSSKSEKSLKCMASVVSYELG